MMTVLFCGMTLLDAGQISPKPRESRTGHLSHLDVDELALDRVDCSCHLVAHVRVDVDGDGFAGTRINMEAVKRSIPIRMNDDLRLVELGDRVHPSCLAGISG